jgi:PTH1 family peptidyl-tRNA hydrolase
MLLIVGLGNPGAGYAGNRHNVGFMVAQAIAKRHGIGPWRRRFQGVAAEGPIGSERVLMLLPGTYMNESGRAVAEAAHFHKLTLSEIVVIHDEIELPPGKVRLKTGGGSAGHNGLRSITAHVGNDYRRVRIGVGHPGDKDLVHGYVLSDFAKDERPWVAALCDIIADNAGLLAKGEDPSFQNKVHLALQAKGFFKEPEPPAKPAKPKSVEMKSGEVTSAAPTGSTNPDESAG